MDSYLQKIKHAIEQTEILLPPSSKLATFGITSVHYYLLTKPLYTEFMPQLEETVVREGKVIAERPRIITPSYLVNLFEGFEHSEEYAEFILRRYGPHEPGLLYRYKNESQGLSIVSDSLDIVAQRLQEKIQREGESLATIIKGIDEMWDISLMKFIYDLTRSSLGSNITELWRSGLFDVDCEGVPKDARNRIEELFEEVRAGRVEPYVLKRELDRWNLFYQYEDRFLDMFRKRWR